MNALDEILSDELLNVSVCDDCVVFTANGTDGHCETCHDDIVCAEVMRWMNGVTNAWPTALWRGVSFYCTDDECEPHFSHASCEGCGQILSGNRHDATVSWH